MNLSMNLAWVHEISQSALAAAVAILGLVILLELRSISRLRRLVDGHLTRVFEQLDLLRAGSQQLAVTNEYVGTAAPAPASRSASAAVPVSKPADMPAAYTGPPLGAGEARLLAALTAARARAQLDRPQGGANH